MEDGGTNWVERIRDAPTLQALEELREEGAANTLVSELIRKEIDWRREKSLRSGNYYSTIDQVIVAGQVRFDNDFLTVEHYKLCCAPSRPTTEALESRQRHQKRKRENEQREARLHRRRQAYEVEVHQLQAPQPQQQQQGRQGEMHCRTATASGVYDPYDFTYEASINARNQPATNDGQSRVSTHTRNRLSIWKKAAVGSAPAGELAHLVPAAVAAAHSYWFVTDFLFGIKRDSHGRQCTRSWAEILRLIHGSNDKAGTKLHLTGIKHAVSNMIMLASQRDYFDCAPCVVVVPAITREEALNWTGGGYPAIMMIGAMEGESTGLQSVATLTFFTHYEETEQKADTEDLRKAIGLLQDYTRSMLFAQKERSPDELEFKITEDVATAFYPSLAPNPSDLNVRKIWFSDNQSNEGHPAPDPLLLVTKSIAVLQKRHGFDIVAVAEPTDDRSERSYQAEEEYLQWRESCASPTNPIIGREIKISTTMPVAVD